MCCEQLQCYAAVFDHAEAVCYLKGVTAIETYHFVEKAGFTTHEMFFREGPGAPNFFSCVFLPFRRVTLTFDPPPPRRRSGVIAALDCDMYDS